MAAGRDDGVVDEQVEPARVVRRDVTFLTSIVVALQGSELAEAVACCPVRCQTRLPSGGTSVVKAPTTWSPARNVVGGFPFPLADAGSNVF